MIDQFGNEVSARTSDFFVSLLGWGEKRTPIKGRMTLFGFDQLRRSKKSRLRGLSKSAKKYSPFTKVQGIGCNRNVMYYSPGFMLLLLLTALL
ncbi:MAG: hypothetical protein WC865_12715 [Bacteroidales bacterium]